ncbi:MAG TPA: SpoIIE family protein phosphatase [Tenuifilaceae bacterium]|nr:SpoIIE family protein phosphatase [Bacteroidales bacterium]MDI9517517.1 SpoIIE family protein phosphatase [Bacteroidota bacterium]NLH55759.1 SpoIIE family protein phosphatase [Rikenellaceae bacterium]OQC64338.1 MAG: Stage II sporulation protein E (SpoIIE) [Bacteroidetes bacterium ADurb.Bin008]HNV82536.1 SpoIIE family protein phosphatase [Tenuifilaceae bacterium]
MRFSASIKTFFISLGLLSITYYALAQVNVDGIPFITNYSPRTYAASESNWSIAQDNRGVMYFGNSNSILEYDGQSWRKIDVPGQTYILSLACGPNGTIYAGGVDDFGHLIANQQGELIYESLAYLLSDSTGISRVWKTHSDGQYVYFCTLQHLFIYEPNSYTLETIELPKDSFWSFMVNNRLYTSNPDSGLMLLEKGKLSQIKGSENFINKDIFTMLPWGGDTLLISTSQDGLCLFNTKTGKVTGFNFNNTAATTNRILHENILYSGVQINDALFAFGTHADGVFVINKQGQIVTHLNESLGMQSETVSNLFFDTAKSDVLWITLTKGITSVNITSPVRMFAGESGLNGAVHNIVKHNNNYYAATMLGVFKLIKKPGENTSFKAISGMPAEAVYSLLTVPTTENNEILIAASVRDIYEVRGDRAFPLNTNLETYKLIKSEKFPNRVYVATSRGIRILQIKNNRLSLDDKVFALQNEAITRICEDKMGNLWCKSFSGLHLIDSEGSTLPLPKSIDGKIGDFLSFDNDIYFNSNGFIYKYLIGNRDFVPCVPLNTLYVNHKETLREIFPINESRALAFFSSGNVTRADLLIKIDNSWHRDTLSLRIVPSMTIYTAMEDYPYTMVGGQDGLFIHNIKRAKEYHQPYESLIRSITIGSDSVIYNGSEGFLSKSTDESLSIQTFTSPISFSHNNIAFVFSASFFENEDELLFQSYLEGNDRNWSTWQNDNYRNYTNLSHGTYRFHVRAKNLYGVVSHQAVVEFRILPPWYLTWWAYILYFLLAFVFIRITVALYTRKLQEDKKRLEAIVKERTAEIVEKNKRIEHQNIAITDSIRYAKRIQTAILPDKQTSNKFEYFIYFAPKDIVSGDFYWIHHFEKKNRLIVIAADCTGHGVPGAFMSMLGTSFLNEIVGKLDIIHSDMILNRLREYVINTLSQGIREGKDDERKDGMDMALASIDLATMKLEFSGANNPLVLISDNQLVEYKPDKMPIGAYVKQDEPFRREEITLKSGDTFYLFSDGFVDQFGGEDGRKYMKKQFKDFLLSIHHESIETQRELLKSEMERWMDGYEQIDDQLVIGMKVV